jgi:hypothetical protein
MLLKKDFEGAVSNIDSRFAADFGWGTRIRT